MTSLTSGTRLAGTEIEALRQAGRRARVLVAGSLNHDEILIADHDPGDEGAVRVRDRVTAPGGHAGNCACALAALGAEVSLLAAVGADDTGELLVSDLRAQRVDVSPIVRIAGSPTGRVVIPVLGEQHFMLLLPGANDELAGEHVRQALAGDYDALVIFDPAAPALAEIFAATAGTALGENLFWNPGGIYAHQRSSAQYLARCRTILVNRNEWPAVQAGLPAGWAGRTEVVQTLGADGSAGHSGEGVLHAPAEAVQLMDPTGAGDAFAAGYVLATLAGLALPRRLAVGNICGALAVTAVGARGRHATLADLAGWRAPC
ncbi:carbohydrate kinase family protein [Jatrophihabitans sp.]|uniref:carbohydrate kinase family protein n=1 Tax=Jatrophihabitans sp. TaxID=1932789 RepID=UPI002D008C76|nr:PfkB family carbohydrate kinase [Jatrophihabitans sp.]